MLLKAIVYLYSEYLEVYITGVLAESKDYEDYYNERSRFYYLRFYSASSFSLLAVRTFKTFSSRSRLLCVTPNR